MDSNQKILVLTDGKAGHENQSRALARALGRPFDVVGVQFTSPRAKALSYLLSHLNVASTRLFTLAEGKTLADLHRAGYAAVLGTGSGTFYAAQTLARQLKCTCGVVLYPRGYRLGAFDCILAPSFDRPKPAANLLEIPANLVAADANFYAAGVENFKAHYAKTTGRTYTPGKAVAVIVGGPNACSTLSAAWMRTQLEEIFASAQAEKDVELWVTTSRRTPPAVEEVVRSFPWQYQLLYSQDHFNPIPAFVACARTLYVTAESTGMLSEACTFGTAEVRALDNLNPGPHKFRRFMEGLRAQGYVDGTRKIDLTPILARAKKLLKLD